MICCINPDCRNPENPDGYTYCIDCGLKLVPILRNRFRMIGFLGKGGFGRTYLAKDIDKLNQRCVVKQLAPNAQGTWARNKAVELFKQEARQLEQLGQHPHIPSLDAYFEQDNYLYLVQQFVDGDNLLKLLQNGGIWQEKHVKQLLLELLPVLKFIHEQKIIHRDIKPENIMRRRSDGLLVLIDFGVSKQLSGTVMSRLGTQIGTPGTEAGRYNHEGPQRTVNISPFFMGKYPITQAQYQALMGNNPSHFKGFFKSKQLPVEQVSWDDAVEFCRKLSQKTGKTYRLPAEAEWEYACRAGTTIPFYFGETITPDLVNYNGNYPYDAAPKGLYREQTTDVGSFPPNSFGLYDMHGNVWEWCSDKWHGNYSGAPTDGSSWETGTDNNRVRRGGAWYSGAVYCRSAYRNLSADCRWWNLGFRVAVASVSSSS